MPALLSISFLQLTNSLLPTPYLYFLVLFFSSLFQSTSTQMEVRSMNSMIGRGNSSNTRTTTQESPQESSWTMYLQDFLISSNHEDDDDDRSSFSLYDYEKCSIISGAASSVARKSSTIKGEVLGFGVDGGYNRSSFMIKRKPKEAVLDDALEDTASSPVNTPKVCNHSESNVESTLQKDDKDISNAEKGSTSGRMDERTESGFIGRE
ncbi:hypothetical protein ACFX13_007542 [Malus domestica]